MVSGRAMAVALAAVAALPLLICILVVGSAGGTPATPATATAASGALPPAAAGSGTLGCTQLEALWEEAGGAPSAAFLAAEVAMAESGGHQDATDNNGNGTVDRGYWQINSSHGALSTYDALGNARAAVLISGDGTDWSPWVTYQKGAEAGQC